jgi:hypothetical protein
MQVMCWEAGGRGRGEDGARAGRWRGDGGMRACRGEVGRYGVRAGRGGAGGEGVGDER